MVRAFLREIPETVENDLAFVNLYALDDVRVRPQYQVRAGVYRLVADYKLIIGKGSSHEMDSPMKRHHDNINLFFGPLDVGFHGHDMLGTGDGDHLGWSSRLKFLRFVVRRDFQRGTSGFVLSRLVFFRENGVVIQKRDAGPFALQDHRASRLLDVSPHAGGLDAVTPQDFDTVNQRLGTVVEAMIACVGHEIETCVNQRFHVIRMYP